MALPKPAQNDSGGVSYLKADMVGPSGTGAELSLNGEVAIEDGNFGEQVVLGVSFDGEDYKWSFKSDSPNYRKLFARFGENEKKWHGPVRVTVKVWNGKPYLAVDDEPKAKKPGKK